MSLVLLLGVSLAGGLGAVLRCVVDGALTARRPAVFPYAVLLVNVSGSLLLGVVTGAALLGPDDPAWAVVVASGFCGGFTTFSTTSFASVDLAVRGRPGFALANALGTLVLCVAAACAGVALTAA